MAPANVCNTTTFDFEDLAQLQWIRYMFIVLYSIIILLSVIGNVFVIFTIYTKKHMRTVTNYYIVNLAMCDLLVAVFVMPLKLLEYLAPCSWHVFGHDTMCSVVSFLLPVFVFASVLTLVAISLERYYAIVYPLKSKIISGISRTRKIIVSTWVVSVILATPYLYNKSYAFNISSKYGSISRQMCVDRFDDIDVAIYGESGRQSGSFRKGFFMFLFAVMYVLPSGIIIYTCVHMALRLLRNVETKRLGVVSNMEESKRKVARMVIFVAIAFIVSWTPFYLVNIISQLQQLSFLKKSNFIFTMLATHLAGFINSCVNPLIYILLSKKFRHCFYKLVVRLCCCLPNHVCGRKKSNRQRTIYGQISYSRSSYAGDMRTFSRSSWRTSAFYRSTCNLSTYENYRRQWRHGQSGSRCTANTNISQLGAESTVSKKFGHEEAPCDFKLIDTSDYKTERRDTVEEESHHLMYDEQTPSDLSTDQAETNLDK